MEWTIEYTKEATKELKSLDKPVRERIRGYVKNLRELSNPRLRGEPLTGNLSDFWKYRVGDYRLICRIQDNKLLILVVKIGHRREVYKN
ncbi:MAG: type II toxin-antitoxin system RelE/ParE family toxin [Synergistaceae bacterium]|nr:type II toxin-antitoxin system RelE/ParE family toxin [Synergistaceae bacterium]